MKLFSGPSNYPLARKISRELSEGEPLGKVLLTKFADGEPYVEFNETSRGYHAVVVQSISRDFATNFVYAGLMADALKRNGAKDITLVAPYLGGSRQDKRAKESRSALTAAWVLSRLHDSGVTQLITVDVHNPAIECAFNGPFMNVPTEEMWADDIRQNYELENSLIASPDTGGSVRAQALADRLKLDAVICYKQRPAPNAIKEIRLLGDVSGKDAILVDDIADTCGTILKCSKLMLEKGARSVRAYVTHGIFSRDALASIEDSPLAEMIVTDTIRNAKADKVKKIRRVSVAPLLVNTIRRATTER